MTIRKSLSNALRTQKKEGAYTYEDLMLSSGCSKTSIRYALNGGNGASLEVFQKLFNCMEVCVQVDIIAIEMSVEDYE